MKNNPRLKVAIVHDSIRYFGGAERVLVALKELFPRADVYTSTICWEDLGAYKKQVFTMRPHTAFVQLIPWFRRHPFLYRYILPFVWRTFDFSGYDLVISSSYAQMSHLIWVPSNIPHICYSHSPPRHLYGLETDFPWKKFIIIYYPARVLNYVLRWFDQQAAKRVTAFIASSAVVAKRIKQHYNRNSVVVYPPAYLGKGNHALRRARAINPPHKDYYLVVSRLSRRKHVEIVIRACNVMKAPLVVAGAGPEESFLRGIAGPSVRFVGFVDRELVPLYQNCKAVIVTSQDEDFGIVAVEASLCGKPVIAFNSGGHKETIKDGETGVLFDTLSTRSLVLAMERLRGLVILPEACRAQAHNFSKKNFHKRMTEATQEYIKQGKHY